MPNSSNHHIVVEKRGGPDVLTVKPQPTPNPGSGEVLIQMEAAGVSGFDLMIRKHWFLGFAKTPYTPGEDIVGTIKEVGPNVTEFRVGQRVAGWTFGDAGGYAQHLVRPADTLVPVPDQLDPVTAAAVITNYLTAALALEKTLQVTAGDKVLVHGAAGGLGSAFLQLGKLAGLTLYGTGGDKAAAHITKNGAEAINYRTENFVKRIRQSPVKRVDIVIDLIGGPRQIWRSRRCLGRGGRLLMLGMAATKKSGISIIPLSMLTAGVIALSPNGVRMPMSPSMMSYPAKNLEWYRSTLADLLAKAAAGQIQPPIAAQVPLRDAARAHELLEAGGVHGKIVLTGWGCLREGAK